MASAEAAKDITYSFTMTIAVPVADVILEILSYVDPQDVARARMVSKWFREMTWERTVWFNQALALAHKYWLPIPFSYLQNLSSVELERLVTRPYRFIKLMKNDDIDLDAAFSQFERYDLFKEELGYNSSQKCVVLPGGMWLLNYYDIHYQKNSIGVEWIGTRERIWEGVYIEVQGEIRDLQCQAIDYGRAAHVLALIDYDEATSMILRIEFPNNEQEQPNLQIIAQTKVSTSSINRCLLDGDLAVISGNNAVWVWDWKRDFKRKQVYHSQAMSEGGLHLSMDRRTKQCLIVNLNHRQFAMLQLPGVNSLENVDQEAQLNSGRLLFCNNNKVATPLAWIPETISSTAATRIVMLYSSGTSLVLLEARDDATLHSHSFEEELDFRRATVTGLELRSSWDGNYDIGIIRHASDNWELSMKRRNNCSDRSRPIDLSPPSKENFWSHSLGPVLELQSFCPLSGKVCFADCGEIQIFDLLT